jgi:hypothetical protein
VILRVGEELRVVFEPHEAGLEAECILAQERLPESLSRRPQEEDARDGELR